jgi:hypothetical protein
MIKKTIDDPKTKADAILLCTMTKVGTLSWMDLLRQGLAPSHRPLELPAYTHSLGTLRFMWTDHVKYPDLMVVCGMRQLIDHNISYFFQFLDSPGRRHLLATEYNKYRGDEWLYTGEKYLKTIKTLSAAALHRDFWNNQHFHTTSLHWLREFMKITGVEINKVAFDKDRGFQIYHIENGREILFYTFEDLPKTQRSILETLGIKGELQNINNGKDKWYKDIRKELTGMMEYSNEYAEELLNNEIAQFFYSRERIENWKTELRIKN